LKTLLTYKQTSL